MLLRLVSKSASNFSRTIILMSGSLKSKFIIFKTRSRVCRIFLRFHEIFSERWIYLTSVKEALQRLKYSSAYNNMLSILDEGVGMITYKYLKG